MQQQYSLGNSATPALQWQAFLGYIAIPAQQSQYLLHNMPIPKKEWAYFLGNTAIHATQ